MSKPSRKNTRTFYLEDAVNAAIIATATLDHGGNRSDYIEMLVVRDFRARIMAAIKQQRQECPHKN